MPSSASWSPSAAIVAPSPAPAVVSASRIRPSDLATVSSSGPFPRASRPAFKERAARDVADLLPDRRARLALGRRREGHAQADETIHGAVELQREERVAVVNRMDGAGERPCRVPSGSTAQPCGAPVTASAR